MKKMLVFLCFFTFSAVALAQAPSHLKGPAAKNYKSWKNQDSQKSSIRLVSVDGPELMGPAAKNRKVRQGKEDKTFQMVSTEKLPLKIVGPKYKNQKPWEGLRATPSGVVRERPVKATESTNTGGGSN